MSPAISCSIWVPLYLVLFSFYSVALGAQSEPTISNCVDPRGDQTYCATDQKMVACFSIDLNGNTDPITEFEIYFGDGSDTVITFADYQQDIRHEYDLGQFYGSCGSRLGFRIEFYSIISGQSRIPGVLMLYYENPPIASFDLPTTTACVGEPLYASSAACPFIGLNVVYEFGDGTPSTQNLVHTYGMPGNFTIIQTATNECGIDTASQLVEILAESIAIIEPIDGIRQDNGDTLIVCLSNGGLVTFNGNTSIYSQSYMWTCLNASVVSDETKDTVAIQFESSGIYTVKLEVDNICNTTDEASVVVEVIDESLSTLNLMRDDNRCIAGEPAIVRLNPMLAKEITISGPNYSSAGEREHLLFNPGEYRVQFTNSYGCEAAASFSLDERQPIFLELIPDTTIVLGQSIFLEPQVNFQRLSFTWSPSIWIKDESLEAPLIQPANSEVYTLTVSDSFGCTATEQVEVLVRDTNTSVFVDVTTGFSPNGDGVNDFFIFFPSIKLVSINRFEIYNRWGNMVYSQIGTIEDIIPGVQVYAWDGTQKGEVLEPGVFVYLIEGVLLTGEVKVQVGDFTLTR